jgi:hypothetical protein
MDHGLRCRDRGERGVWMLKGADSLLFLYFRVVERRGRGGSTCAVLEVVFVAGEA